MEHKHQAPRVSFLPPIPELKIAADLVALSCDRLLVGDEVQARSYLDQANMPKLRAYTRSIASQVTHEIHRFREVSGLAPVVPMPERGRRQPSTAIALEIYCRDGFRCRYCGCRIIFPLAQNVISELLPGAVQWGSRDMELNAAFYTLKGVLDHVDPHAHGGTSEPENLVVACQPCNYGKGNWFIQQLGLSDPRLRPPLLDDWDGLRRVIPLKPVRTTASTKRILLQPNKDPKPTVKRLSLPKLGLSLDEFTSAFSPQDRQCLDGLLQIVEACSDIGVHWALEQVLLVKMPGGDHVLNALGVEPDANIQVPWSIGPYKIAFHPFAEALAAALPGATAYESEKMWRVRCFGRAPRISELMQDPESLHSAFRSLRRSLDRPTI